MSRLTAAIVGTIVWVAFGPAAPCRAEEVTYEWSATGSGSGAFAGQVEARGTVTYSSQGWTQQSADYGFAVSSDAEFVRYSFSIGGQTYVSGPVISGWMYAVNDAPYFSFAHRDEIRIEASEGVFTLPVGPVPAQSFTLLIRRLVGLPTTPDELVTSGSFPLQLPLAGSAPGEFTAALLRVNAATWSGTVTSLIDVTDRTPPVIECPEDVTVECIGDPTYAFWAEPTATDDSDGPITVTSSHQSGDAFPLGATLVTYVATDAAGNSSTCSFTVHIVDTTPPQLAHPHDTWVFLPYAGKPGEMFSFEFLVDAEDLCDPMPYTRITTVDCARLGYPPTRGFREDDWALAGDLMLNLRCFMGREYVVTVTCTDESGNVSTKRFRITFEMPRPGGPPVEKPPVFHIRTSTASIGVRG